MQKKPSEPKRYHKGLLGPCEYEASVSLYFAAFSGCLYPELKGNNLHLDTSSSNPQMLWQHVWVLFFSAPCCLHARPQSVGVAWDWSLEQSAEMSKQKAAMSVMHTVIFLSLLALLFSRERILENPWRAVLGFSMIAGTSRKPLKMKYIIALTE